MVTPLTPGQSGSALQGTNIFFDDLPVPVFFKNLDGTYLDCNKNFEHLTGKKRHDIIGHQIRDVFPPKIASVFQGQFDQVCQSGSSASFEFMIQFPDGKKRYYLIKYANVFDDYHKHVGISGVAMEITPIREHALEIHQSQVENCHRKQYILLDEAEQLQVELRERQWELASHLSLLVQSEKNLEQQQRGLESLQPFLNEQGLELFQNMQKEKLLGSFQDTWIEFERKFDEIHYSFYQKLEKICNGITRSEKKLCAYLKMNLTSTDISTLEKKSLNSINVAFSRLREKFKVSSNDEIKTHLSDL